MIIYNIMIYLRYLTFHFSPLDKHGFSLLSRKKFRIINEFYILKKSWLIYWMILIVILGYASTGHLPG